MDIQSLPAKGSRVVDPCVGALERPGRYLSAVTDSTAWTIIRDAAAGDPEPRSLFVRTYAPVIRAYLRARWRGSNLIQEVDDAVQEVFLDCFKEGGVLASADPARDFRPYLYGVVRNAARHAETRRARSKEQPAPSGFDPAQDPELSQVFDRAWALAVVQGALRRLQDERHVELLRLRFQEDLPIREIAKRWNEDAAKLHHEYAKARAAYEDALVDTVRFHRPGNREQALEEARRLLALLA